MAKSWNVDELFERVRGFQGACVITAAAELDVFTVLSAAPATAAGLAGRIGSDVRGTAVLLDALAALDLLVKRGDEYHVPSEVADLLAEGSSVNVLSAVRHQANCLRRWAQLARVLKTGQPAETGPSIRGQAGDCEAFIGAMNNFADSTSPQIIERLMPLPFQRLLDVGGDSGTWTIAFLRAVPDATAVLFDLPDVIPLARMRLTRAGLIERVSLVAGDYNAGELPGGADLAWLSAVAHQNSREQNRALYARIRSALTAGGIVVIRDVVMHSSRTQPPAGALFAVNMLVGTKGGSTFTFEEFEEDLTAAGFRDIRLIHQDQAMSSLIRATKT
jgi:hypothetical protein